MKRNRWISRQDVKSLALIALTIAALIVAAWLAGDANPEMFGYDNDPRR